jgi:hypothetical protein
MISVDVSVLDDYQVFYHLVAGVQRFVQKAVHNLNNLLAQVLESIELGELDLSHDPPQFLIHKLNTLERRRFKSLDLLLGQNFKGNFGDEKVRPQRAGVADGCFQVFICETVKGVYFQEGFVENLIENVI